MQTASHDVAKFFTQTELASLFEHTMIGDELAMLEHCVPQFRHALRGGAHRGENRWSPSVVRQIGEFEHLLEISTGLGSALAIALVDHEDVGDLHQARFVGLHRIAPAWVDHNNGGVGFARDLDLYLSDTNGLDQDPFATNGIEQANGLGGRQRQAAKMTTRGHRANEHTGIGGVILHTHTIAQDGAAGKR